MARRECWTGHRRDAQHRREHLTQVALNTRLELVRAIVQFADTDNAIPLAQFQRFGRDARILSCKPTLHALRRRSNRSRTKSKLLNTRGDAFNLRQTAY